MLLLELKPNVTNQDLLNFGFRIVDVDENVKVFEYECTLDTYIRTDLESREIIMGQFYGDLPPVIYDCELVPIFKMFEYNLIQIRSDINVKKL